MEKEKDSKKKDDLVEETEKTEEVVSKTKKKSNVGVIVLLVIIILGLVGYICYDNGVFNNLFDKKTTPEPTPVEKASEPEVKVVRADDKKYLIANINDNWVELDSSIDGFSVFGIKDNVVYYTDSEKIMYTNLKDETLKSNVLVASKTQPCKGHILSGSLVGDKLYFKLSTSCHDAELVSLDINSTSISEAKKVVDYADFYTVKDQYLFFNIGWNCQDFMFYKLDFNSNKSTTIGKGICQFSVVDDSIIYFQNKDSYNYDSAQVKKSNKTGYYVYDINSSTSKKIDSINIYYDVDDDNYANGTIYNDDIYYIDGNKLNKYHNGNIETLFVYDNSDNDEMNYHKIKNPIVVQDNVVLVKELLLHPDDDPDIRYAVGDEEQKVVINGKLYSEKDAKSFLDTYKVTMTDGSTRTFSILDTISY